MRYRVYYNPSPLGIGILCSASDNYDSILYPHYHLEYELSIVLSGVHLLILEEETMRLPPGSLTLIRPNEVHTRKMEVRGKFITVAFPAVELNALVKYVGEGIPTCALWGCRPPVAMLNPGDVERSIRRIERVNLFCSSNAPRALAELRALLVDLCLYHLANPDALPSARTPWLTKLINEMQKPENIRKGLPAMLDLTPYSHEYICREFKRMMDCTPTEYINSARLDLARRMLENPTLSIVDICYAVGFESVSYFYQLFKAKFGNTPSRYRKHHFIAYPDMPPDQFRALVE
ncbi:AraC family transcriptional regulator [Bacillota bacterium Meth-B3]|nr:AraC family transcriptional regulator [Christensenellaceae bacterium]MEA5066897.1 AraC family transcriptional regulator [Eubacteriales bacterium]MEA5069624.1 AraC family transcriptional regulator [Christensenellaceae bacterium]